MDDSIPKTEMECNYGVEKLLQPLSKIPWNGGFTGGGTKIWFYGRCYENAVLRRGHKMQFCGEDTKCSFAEGTQKCVITGAVNFAIFPPIHYTLDIVTKV